MKLNNPKGERVKACYRTINEEQKERLHVVQANTVADPNAVMIHSNHAAIALRAVMRAWRLDCLADVTSLYELVVDEDELNIREVTDRKFIFTGLFFSIRLL